MIRSAPSALPIDFLEYRHGIAGSFATAGKQPPRRRARAHRSLRAAPRQFFVDIRTELAAGHPATALSLLNEALSFIDDATDVVAPHADGPPSAGA